MGVKSRPKTLKTLLVSRTFVYGLEQVLHIIDVLSLDELQLALIFGPENPASKQKSKLNAFA